MVSKKTDVKKMLLLGWIICVIGALFYFYEYLLRIEPSVMMPNLMSTFGISAGLLGLIIALYYYAYTPLQLVVGVLIDKYGSRLTLLFAILACTFGSLLFSISHSLYIVGFGRFLIGTGSAFAFVGVLKLAAEWLPERHFALFAGLATSFGMIGGIVGDIFLTMSVHTVGWKHTLHISTLVGLLLTFVIWFVVRDAPRKQLSYGRKRGFDEKKISYEEVFVGLKRIVRNPQMWFIGLIGCFFYLSLSAFGELWCIPFLQAVYNISAHKAAVACSMIFIGWLVGGPFNGWLSDKIKTRKFLLSIGGFLAAISISVVIFNPLHLSMYELCFVLFLFGFFCSTEILCFVLSREYNPKKIAGTSIASTNLLIMLGGVIFQPLVGFLLDLHVSGKLYVYSAMDYQHALWLLPIFILVGAVLALFLRERHLLSSAIR